ncbi:MAG: L-glutamate gamma-semialdehyde dehydrogenase [Sandaracinaceae bacterium]
MRRMSVNIPLPENEPVQHHAPGSPERAELEPVLAAIAAEAMEIPMIIGGKPVHSSPDIEVVMPHRHAHVLARAHEASAEHVGQAIDAAMAAAPAWAATPFEDRAAIFLRAAELLCTTWRRRIDAVTMLGQSKTVYQAEIDAVCELADFWRFNVAFLEEILSEQPISPPGVWNRIDHRPLEGFVLAISPFNFLSICANLPTAPILCGNVALWKPSNTSLRGCWEIMELLREAGLPDGVLGFLPGAGPVQGAAALDSEHLAGVHFTGSTATFNTLYRGVADRLDRYRTYPRLVGETGGKDFIVAHQSADPAALSTAITRGAFEYQGQKCSAASRVYVPESLWAEVKPRVVADLEAIEFGDVTDFRVFGGAVIDERAFDKIEGFIQYARESDAEVIGGACDKSQGYFIQPTIVETRDPDYRLLKEEIFGPVVTVYPYADSVPFEEVLALVDRTSPYGLTGAVFANDRRAVRKALDGLRNAAGNFYINDKPTGAVVCQQPFGGARRSGTNDKAGFKYNLLRWLSPRSIKETLAPPYDFRYPSMG